MFGIVACRIAGWGWRRARFGAHRRGEPQPDSERRCRRHPRVSCPQNAPTRHRRTGTQLSCVASTASVLLDTTNHSRESHVHSFENMSPSLTLTASSRFSPRPTSRSSLTEKLGAVRVRPPGSGGKSVHLRRSGPSRRVSTSSTDRAVAIANACLKSCQVVSGLFLKSSSDAPRHIVDVRKASVRAKSEPWDSPEFPVAICYVAIPNCVPRVPPCSETGPAQKSKVAKKQNCPNRRATPRRLTRGAAAATPPSYALNRRSSIRSYRI